MRIGTLELTHPTVLAPLAGITDSPFRLLVKRFGAGLVCSEMVSANALVHRQIKTLGMMTIHPDERPVSIQIFGSDPGIMASAAAMVAEAGADGVDINMGCAVRKIVKTGAGVALMREPEKVAAVLKAVRRAIAIPLTIKVRSGWTRDGEQAMRIARMAEDAGVDAVAVHPRSASQGFSGSADWRLIREIAREIAIPVIGNGDVRSPEDALRMLDETRCAAVMIGRAAVSRPWILGEVHAALLGEKARAPGIAEHFEMMRHFVDAMADRYGEAAGCRMLRSRLGWLAKGLRHAGRFRETIKRIESRSEAMALLADYERRLSLEAEAGERVDSGGIRRVEAGRHRGGDAAPCGEVSGHLHPLGVERGHEVFEDAVHDVFVEDADVSVL